MNIAKRYLLKKDLPTELAGTIYYLNGNSYYPCRKSDGTMFNIEDMKGMSIAKHIVENTPDWFAEEVLPSDVQVKESNSVISIQPCSFINDNRWYEFQLDKPLDDNNKLDKISEQISKALNNDVPEQNRFATLSQVMKIVDEWLNSEDVFILDKEDGNKLPDAWIECVSGSLLKRMSVILSQKAETPVVDDDEHDMVSLRSYIKYLEETIAINKDKVYTQSDVESIRKHAFDESRLLNVEIFSGKEVRKCLVHKTYSDYLSSLPFTDKEAKSFLIKDKGYSGEKLVELLRDCVASTWGNPSIYKTQEIFDKFLHDRNLTTTDQQKKEVSLPKEAIEPEVKNNEVVENKTWWQKLGVKFDGKLYTHPKTNTYDNLDKVIEELNLVTKGK